MSILINVALVSIGNILIKYDDFKLAFLTRVLARDEENWQLLMVTKDEKELSAFVGSYFECQRELKNVFFIEPEYFDQEKKYNNDYD